MRQFRGCSYLVYDKYEYDPTTKIVSFAGDVRKLGDVKNISREIANESEEVWANNQLQDTTYGGTAVTRTFGCTRIDPEVEADVLGNTPVTIGTNTLYATAPDGTKKPYIAVGYALHDGDVDNPCLIVWAYKGIVNSISQVANTIDRGTGSEGQELNITFHAPDKAWTKTAERNLDFTLPITDTNKALVPTWFEQVVTPDNAETVLVVSE